MFPQTRVSVVERLTSSDASQRTLAWDALVSAYWRPVYKYLRARWRMAPDEAEDLTQEFFARAFEKGFFDTYDPRRARFRTWLRTCLDGVAGHHREAAGRLKRGGGTTMVPLDFAAAENEAHGVTMRADADLDAWFQQEFVRDLFARAVDALRSELHASGRDGHFALFEACDLADLDDRDRPSYKELAGRHGCSVHDVTNRLAAVRRRLREHVLELLRATCASDEEFEVDARMLFRS